MNLKFKKSKAFFSPRSKTIILISIILAFAFIAIIMSSRGNTESLSKNASLDAQNQNAQDKNANNTDNTVDIQNSASQQKENPIVLMQTNRGNIKLELFINSAPKTVENFLNLAQKGFYNRIKFHRIIPNFMIQTGDPNSRDSNWVDDGTGGPGYKFQDEINPESIELDQNTIQMLEEQGYVFNKNLESRKLERGILAMANSGPNTNGSQFFIVTAQSTPWLDGRHTAFGAVIDGMAVVDAISQVPRNQNDHPTIDVVINNVEWINQNEK